MLRILMLCCVLAGPVWGGSLNVPGSPKIIDTQTGISPFALPIGVWDGAVPHIKIPGDVSHQVLYLNRDAGVYRVIDGLSQQLQDQGYALRLECRDQICGGYDFRFALPLIAPPKMFVDLGHYGVVSATHSDGRAVLALASKTQDNIHLHLTTITPVDEAPVIIENIAPPVLDLAQSLDEKGYYILSDLEFEKGAAALDGQEFSSLNDLADYLAAQPNLSIALVGHTDATGGLAGNIALSQKRASSVRQILIDQYGVAPNRVESDGVGYLSPIALNTTAEGRAQNRRVEVIITSSE